MLFQTEPVSVTVTRLLPLPVDRSPKFAPVLKTVPLLAIVNVLKEEL